MPQTMDETVLDDPKTPAHLFMWRAARNYFVGTPGSPEYTRLQLQHDSDGDKENLAPISPVKSGRFSPRKQVGGGQTGRMETPLKRKHSAIAVNTELQAQEVQRQAPMVSPTKSILRTPGAMTPRMKEKAGREMRVAFRSVSLSTNESPEVRRKNSTTTSKTQNQAIFEILEDTASTKGKTHNAQTTTLAAKSKSNGNPELKSGANARTNPRSKDTSTAPLSTAPADTTTDILAEHDRRTATEMRRLIRHSQKWRDAAKRLDEENLKLRIMLEEVRKENARLQGRLRMLGGRSAENLRTADLQKTAMKEQAVQILRDAEVVERSKKQGIEREIKTKASTRGGEQILKSVDEERPYEEDAETRAMREMHELLDLTPPFDEQETQTHAHPTASDNKASESLRSISAPIAPSHHATQSSTYARPVSASAELPRQPSSDAIIPATNESELIKAANLRQNIGRPASISQPTTGCQHSTTPQTKRRVETDNNHIQAQRIQAQIFNTHAQPHKPTANANQQPTPRLPPPPSAKNQPSPLTALQHRIEGSILPASNTAERLGMPETRVAEVRRRLAAKKQGRAASNHAVPEDGVRGGSGRWLEKSVGDKTREESRLSGVGGDSVDWIGV
jgi:hypothetical protein